MNRIGMVSTSRAGCTFIRKYLCNIYGMQDPNSWLKKNDYRNIEHMPFANERHILKILVHYVPKHDLDITITHNKLLHNMTFDTHPPAAPPPTNLTPTNQPP